MPSRDSLVFAGITGRRRISRKPSLFFNTQRQPYILSQQCYQSFGIMGPGKVDCLVHQKGLEILLYALAVESDPVGWTSLAMAMSCRPH